MMMISMYVSLYIYIYIKASGQVSAVPIYDKGMWTSPLMGCEHLVLPFSCWFFVLAMEKNKGMQCMDTVFLSTPYVPPHFFIEIFHKNAMGSQVNNDYNFEE